MPTGGSTVHTAGITDLDAPTLYALLRLRVDVFVVEQNCAYPELDGRDVEPATRHLWTADDAGPTAYLRLLTEIEGHRIGRVCTRRDARGAGLAVHLMHAAVALCGPGPIVLDAQSRLGGWYERFGFAASGPEFVEDGIAHIPMRRSGAPYIT